MLFINLNLTEVQKKPKQLYEKQRVLANIAARGCHPILYNTQTAVSVAFHMKFISLPMKQVLTLLSKQCSLRLILLPILFSALVDLNPAKPTVQLNKSTLFVLSNLFSYDAKHSQQGHMPYI